MSKRCNEKRICESCKKTYIAKVVTARFCSRQCMYSWRSSLPTTKNSPKKREVKILGQKKCKFCFNVFNITKSRKDFCNKKCMYEWRKSLHWEMINCIGCGKKFSRRKNEKHHGTGLPKQYCSNDCSRRSPQKREKIRKWALSDKNHWNRFDVQKKGKKTKKKLYGDEDYNNMEKNIQTCLSRYGKPYATTKDGKPYCIINNGKRVSKVQRHLYEQIKQEHSDAELEHWLKDAQKSVDIYIPSKKKIIEVYGTYWHCDPRKYSKDFYNKVSKMTAEEIWKRDEARIKQLEYLGYEVEIKWERDI